MFSRGCGSHTGSPCGTPADINRKSGHLISFLGMRPTLKRRRATVRTVIERWGRLDVLVNNAGAGAASNRLLLVRFQLAVLRPNRRREWLILCNHSRATARALGIVSEGDGPSSGFVVS
jgi:NAD(P)-dependent dehydrogenase (short-subunit alcohol dehydrogenase family)